MDQAGIEPAVSRLPTERHTTRPLALTTIRQMNVFKTSDLCTENIILSV